MRLSVPGEFTSLTLATWVRVQGLDRQFNSLFMCDGFGAGTLHWLIRNDGVLGLTVIGEKPEIDQIDQIEAEFENEVEHRDQPTGFADWGGAIAFGSNTAWHFDANTLPTNSETDFYSVALHELGQSEVGDVRRFLGAEEDVARLEIAVQNAALVRMVYRAGDDGQ